MVRVWLLATIALLPTVSAQRAEFLLEDPADDNGAAPPGTDLLSMLAEADGRWVNLTVRLDEFPVLQTPYQLDVMPAGWQVFVSCDISPMDGPLAGSSSCTGARIERQPETAPGPAAIQPVDFAVVLTLQPNDKGFQVAIPYYAFVDVNRTPIEVFRATSGNGVTITTSFVYPDRADIARAETEWWMPILESGNFPQLPAQNETSHSPVRESPPGLAPAGILLMFAAAAIESRIKRHQATNAVN